MKKLIVILVCISLTACGSISNKFGKIRSNFKNGNFVVRLYSGGIIVKEWKVNGYINTEHQTDGYYWSDNGKIVRVSGTITIEEI